MPPPLPPITTDQQVAPILQAHEDALTAQVPSYLKEALPESASSIFGDYVKTGAQDLKQKAGQALGALTSFVSSTKQSALSSLGGATSYDRNSYFQGAGVGNNVPDGYKQMFTNNATDVATPEILSHILHKENQPGDPNAIHLNKDGTRDYGLMQINSSVLKDVQKSFKNEGRIFNPLNPDDSVHAAAFLMGQNATIFKDKTGRMPTTDEMWSVYNSPVEAAKKVIEAQKVTKLAKNE